MVTSTSSIGTWSARSSTGGRRGAFSAKRGPECAVQHPGQGTPRGPLYQFFTSPRIRRRPLGNPKNCCRGLNRAKDISDLPGKRNLILLLYFAILRHCTLIKWEK